MILDIILIFLFLIIFILAAYFMAYMRNRSVSQKPTNTFFHVNQSTPIGYNSSDGIVSGYNDVLSEDESVHETSEDYDRNMPEAGTITESKYEEQPTIPPTTCLDTLDQAHQNADGGGVWDQLGCDEWWKNNLPGALMAFFGAGMQINQFLNNMKVRMSGKEYYEIRKRMNQFGFVDADGNIIKNFNPDFMDVDDFNRIMADPRNGRAASAFGSDMKNKDNFKKYGGSRGLKIIDVPKSSINSIQDFMDKLGPDYAEILRKRMPGIDIEEFLRNTNDTLPFGVNMSEYKNIDINSDMRRITYDPDLDIEKTLKADADRIQKLNDLQSDYQNIKSVDDVDFLANLPDDLDDPSNATKKKKLFESYGIDVDQPVADVRTRFQTELADFNDKGIFASYDTVTSSNGTVTKVRNNDAMLELKTRYEELFPGPDAKPFRGTASITDIAEHSDFTTQDFENLRNNKFIDPNLELVYEDGKKPKLQLLQLEPHNMEVDIKALKNIDAIEIQPHLDLLSNGMGTPEEQASFDKIKNNIDEINSRIVDTPGRSPGLLNNLDLIDTDTFRELKKLDIIPNDYVKYDDLSVSLRQKSAGIGADVNAAKIGAGFDDGTFNSAAFKELGGNLKTSVGLGAVLGVGMGLATSDMDDPDEREKFAIETTAMILGTALAEVGEFVIERSATTLGRKIAAAGGIKGVGKAAGQAAVRGATTLVSNVLSKTPLKFLGTKMGKAVAKKIAQRAAQKAGAVGAVKLGKRLVMKGVTRTLQAKVAAKAAGKAAAAAGKAIVKRLASTMAGKAVSAVASKLALGPPGAVLLVVDVVGLILDLTDNCGFDSKIKYRKQWQDEFAMYEEMHKAIMKSMGKSYPGQAKPDLLRTYTEYNPMTGEAQQKINPQDKQEYDRYRNSYFEKCNLVTDATCRDNTFSALATNAIRQGRMHAVNNLDTNMINPYSIQPIIVDNMKVGDAALYSRLTLSSNLQVLGSALDYARDLIDGNIVASTERIKSQKIELKPINKLISEEINSKAILYYIICFLAIVIAIVFTLKLF